MKSTLLCIFLLFLVCVSGSPAQTSESRRSRGALIDAWVRLDLAQTLPCLYAQQHIADELAALYRLEGKEAQAQFLEMNDPAALRSSMILIQKNPVQEFPPYEPAKYKITVSKARDGSYVWHVPLACTSHRIRPDAPEYHRAVKYIGPLDIGASKECDPLPYGIRLRNGGG